MKTTEKTLWGYPQEELDASTNKASPFFESIHLLSSITTESLYVIDIPQRQFCYISPDDLFLCGFSVEEAMEQGYDFYSKIIYPEDLPVWTEILNVVCQYLRNYKEKLDERNYFSCTFRLLRKYSFTPRPLSQMIYHRIQPMWIANKLRYLICWIGSSTIKKAGNLRLYNKGGSTYEEYSFVTKRWKQNTIEPLTEREKVILMLAQQGKSTVEIAKNLCKAHFTIRNQIKSLFSKLKVHSMQEAIEIASYHGMLHSQQK